jgi:hypothetical protein
MLKSVISTFILGLYKYKFLCTPPVFLVIIFTLNNHLKAKRDLLEILVSKTFFINGKCNLLILHCNGV